MTSTGFQVWDLELDDVAKAIAASSDGDSCSHAKKAAQRRLTERASPAKEVLVDEVQSLRGPHRLRAAVRRRAERRVRPEGPPRHDGVGVRVGETGGRD